MSKKNKAKLKKQLKAEFISKNSNEASFQVSAAENKINNNKVSIQNDQLAENMPQIKADLVKTGIIIVILIAIIAALAILGPKYQILDKTGDYLFKILNLNK